MRAVIFIDGAYLQTQLKNNGLEADYLHIADHLLAPLRASFPLDLLRCYYYYCPPYMSQEPTEDELKRMEVHETFVHELHSLGRWAIRLGKLQKRWEGQREVYEQKRVDVLLSVDMVRHAAAGHIQHAVLVAGDSDFVPAVEAAKEHGVTVSLWCGAAKTVHKDLIAQADEVYAFDWSTFPLIPNGNEPQRSPRPRNQNVGNQSSQTQTPQAEGGQRSSSSRRRRGGSNRNQSRPRAEEQASEPQSSSSEPKKTAWRDRFKSLAGKKED
ncbi:MAG: NYN domain-containing protein [Proteobacteria bacterium]|nr:MAG: NYN domain-containing protein [Pseudomonadota bacterium]